MERTKEIQEFYSEAKKQEHLILRWFKEVKGHAGRHSTQDEDKYMDIDLWVTGKSGKQVSLSVKVNEPKYFDAPFNFELEVLMQSGVEYKSWYYNSEAMYYVIWKRKTISTGNLWLIDSTKLHKYVEREGFDVICTTRREVAERELSTGKKRTTIGLIEQENLIDAGIARRIGWLDVKKLGKEVLTTRRVC